MHSVKVKIQTNLPVSPALGAAVTTELTALLTREMPPPAAPVASTIESNTRLVLAGSQEPAAFLEIRSSHLPPQGRTLGHALAELIHRHLGVPVPRVYVKFISSTSDAQRHAAAV